jgi:Amt family ammonium transporter
MNAGNTAWVLVSAALVLFMTPGLALFYGGMVRSKNVLSVIVQSFSAIGLVTLVWAVLGFSLAFGGGSASRVIGDLHFFGLANLGHSLPGFSHLEVSPEAVMVFQLMFAVITAALLVGAGADRMRLSGYALLVCAWLLLVYVPIAHWVFSPTGWLARLGVLDFAGGTVVEINSGFSALALALVLKRRRGWPREPMRPHSIPLTVIGAGILWFGWFGFNAGSALAANTSAVHAFVNTQLAAATGLLGWMLFEAVKDQVSTALGAVSGAVAGMVAITPCAGYVGPMPALAIGAVAGLLCPLAVQLKYRFLYDDSLDVVAVHGVGGLIGMVLLGVFAERSVAPAGANGLAFGGVHLFGVEVLAAAVAAVYCFSVTYVLARLVNRFVGLRVTPDQEAQGLDVTLHGENAYSTSAPGQLMPSGAAQRIGE